MELQGGTQPRLHSRDLLVPLTRLREYLMQQGEPDSRLNPGWLAKILDTDERELLCALAYAVRDGLVELHWEVYCPVCGRSPDEFASLEEARSHIECDNL